MLSKAKILSKAILGDCKKSRQNAFEKMCSACFSLRYV